jgi:hypothetical protein
MIKFREEIVAANNGEHFEQPFYIWDIADNIGAADAFLEQLRSMFDDVWFVDIDLLNTAKNTHVGTLFVVQATETDIKNWFARGVFDKKFWPVPKCDKPNLCIFISESVPTGKLFGGSDTSGVHISPASYVKFDKFDREANVRHILRDHDLSNDTANYIAMSCDDDYARIMSMCDAIDAFHESKIMSGEVSDNSSAWLNASAIEFLRSNATTSLLTNFEISDMIVMLPSCYNNTSHSWRGQIEKYFRDISRAPESVLSLVVNTYTTMRKCMAMRGKSVEEISEFYSLHPYRTRIMDEKARFYRESQVDELLHRLKWLDTMIKSGNVDEAQVNMLIALEVCEVCCR